MRKTPRRWSAVVAVAALTFTMGAAQAGPTAAADDTRASTAHRIAHRAQTATVTLITGDTVTVTTGPSGETSVRVAPGTNGGPAEYLSRTRDGDRYIFPVEAIPALAAGSLDPELFNVTGLVRQGYDDAHTDRIPVIAVYESAAAVAPQAAPAAPDGSRRTRVLDSIDAVALSTDKARAAAFWRTVDADLADEPSSARAVPGPDLQKLWLDRRAHAMLADATEQVRAPAAWAAGYDGAGSTVAVLDTGVDPDHPDLAGQIVGTANFTYAPAYDGSGHGTHTASIVAGTGAASGGAQKGVAPGADLLIGKVLNNSGNGALSWIIDGMEWAVAHDADVVSMSLGTRDRGGCADPVAQAAARLSDQALFVVAAGNDGPHEETIASPACVPGVLTVGAVDDNDATADFSSRGFVPQTHTLKPEIAAPGVGILAARAGGRGEDAYVTMSGTSMAAPFVAGAAAILAEQHPQWSPAQLKAALISAADPDVPGDVDEVGAGRLDVGAAVTAPVHGTGVVDAGTFGWPQSAEDQKTVEVPFTNTAQQPVTLHLELTDVVGNDGAAAPSGLVSLEQQTLTVPSGDSVTAGLHIRPGVGIPLSQYGVFAGRIVATTDGGATITTPFTFYVEPETVQLTVQLRNRDGQTPDVSRVNIANVDTGTADWEFLADTDTATFNVRAGPTFIAAFVFDYGAGSPSTDSFVNTASLLSYPQVKLTEDTTITLDARNAHEVQVSGPRPLETHASYLGFARWGQMWLLREGIINQGTIKHYYAWSSGQATKGEFAFQSLWRLGKPHLSLQTVGPNPMSIPAWYSTSMYAITDGQLFHGRGTAELVDAGTGTAEELAAADAEGKVVLVQEGTSWKLYDLVEDAKAAGAVAIILHRKEPGRWSTAATNELPVVTVTSATYQRLRERLDASGPDDPIQVRWNGTPYSPYQYNLVFSERGSIPSDVHYRIRPGQLTRVEANYYSVGTVPQTIDGLDYRAPWNPGEYISVGLAMRVPVPGERIEYYTPAPGLWRHSTPSAPNGGFYINATHHYQEPERLHEDWFGGVLRPVAGREFTTGEENLVGVRQGDVFRLQFKDGYFGDSTIGHWAAGNSLTPGSLALRRNGELIGAFDALGGRFSVPAEPARYALTLRTRPYPDGNPQWQLSTSTTTTFRFDSAHVDRWEPLPLMFPTYDVGLDLHNRAPATAHLRMFLSATGHWGYSPAKIVDASLEYSYDAGNTWHTARTRMVHGRWMGILDHRNHSGDTVTLRTELTDARGTSVTQTVVAAYTIR